MDTPLRTCDATIRQEAGEFGFVPVVCRQSRYVRTYITTGGIRVGFCPIDGHEANVRRRFAEQQEPPEPEWTLGRHVANDDYDIGDNGAVIPRDLDAPDPIDEYKNWTESEKAYGR